MEVTCPKCGFRGTIDDELIPEAGRTIRCSKCRETFHVEKYVPGANTVSYLDLKPSISDDSVEREWGDYYEEIKRFLSPGGMKKARDLIAKAHETDENPEMTIKKISEMILSLKPGEKMKAIRELVGKILRIEESYMEAEQDKEHIANHPDIRGARLQYSSGETADGPCFSRACERAIIRGKNVKRKGSDITADFYFDEANIPWFPHCPHCTCFVAKFLYRDDYPEKERPPRSKIRIQ